MIAFLFDTETTALVDNHVIKLDKQPQIIEFYSCVADLENGEVLSEIDTLIKPSEPIPEKISSITGITNEMVADAPTMTDKLPSIILAIEAAPIVIAHNLSYDMEIMDFAAERIGIKIKWPRRKICTVESTIHVKGYRLNLASLHELLTGETFMGAHRAKADVHALLRCCVKLHERGMI